MANDEHLEILEQGVSVWNEWRIKYPEIEPDLANVTLRDIDLSGADFHGANLSNADLRLAGIPGANLRRASLRLANLTKASLTGADLTGADLRGANLTHANLDTANLSNANLDLTFLTHTNLVSAILTGAQLRAADLSDTLLRYARLKGADLTGAVLHHTDLTNSKMNSANLTSARIIGAIFSGTDLTDADFSRTTMRDNVFAELDLRKVKGLETINYWAPSDISISTIVLSEGDIPKSFLLGCGMPDALIAQIPSLVRAIQPNQFHSCFISYSSKDEDFAMRLHERMRSSGLRVWFAPEDIKGGEKLNEQIDKAIQGYDRLLIVLSESSLQSEWVMTEIRRARKAEVKENRRKLFPIRLTDYETLKEWECFDADTGKDLAVEVREYFIPDFSNWKSRNDFEKAFMRLLSDLKASAK